MFQQPASLYTPGFPEDPMRNGDRLLIACWDGDIGELRQVVQEATGAARGRTGPLRPPMLLRKQSSFALLSRSKSKRRLATIEKPKKAEDLDRMVSRRVDVDQNNCLHVCAYRGGMLLLRFLFQKLGPEATLRLVDSRNKAQRTPLHFACQRDRPDIAMELLRAGADPAAADVNGYTPLHLAVEANSVQVVALYAERGLPLDVPTCAGVTPLIVACRNDFREIAFSLARSGSDICKRSTLHDGVNYQSPYVIAQRAGWGEALRRSGAVPQRPDPPYLVRQTDEEAYFRWNSPAGRSAPVDHFRLQVKIIDRLQPDAPWITVADGVKEMTHTFYTCRAHCSTFSRAALPEDLLPSEVYVVRVFAHSIVGWSEPSMPSRVFQTAPAAPSRPDPPIATHVSNTSITLQWRLPDCNGVPIDYSELQWRLCHSEYTDWTTVPERITVTRPEDSDDEPSSSESDTDEEENPEKHAEYARYTLNQLTPQLFYRFRVRCHNSMGWSYLSQATGRVRAVTSRFARRGAIDLAGEMSATLVGTALHAKGRFLAFDRSRVDEKSRDMLAEQHRAAFGRNRRRKIAAIRLQSFWRATRLRIMYAQFTKDAHARRRFLVEYDMEDAFLDEWRALLLKHKLHAMAVAQVDQDRRDAKRGRKMQRMLRRERRKIIRSRRAAAAAAQAAADEKAAAAAAAAEIDQSHGSDFLP